MRLEDVCSPGVRVAYRDQALGEAAQAMLDFHVGALIVVEPDDAKLSRGGRRDDPAAAFAGG